MSFKFIHVSWKNSVVVISFFIVLLNSSLFAENEDGKVKIGGYGELHLNAVVPDTGVRKPAEFDFHRFVLLFAVQFNAQWSFESELELEHNWVEGGTALNSEKTGYLILEQAFLQWEPRTELAFRAGIMLQPIGLINEHHEPSLFNTVERPVYHNQIIPTTWFGAGVAVGGNIFGGTARYDLLITEGLDNRKFSKSSAIRSGRQKGFYSKLDNIMTTLRLDYTGRPGMQAGGSIAVNEMVSDRDRGNLNIYKRAIISEIHLSYKSQGIRGSVEFANISYDAISGRGGDLQNSQGFTTELGYDVLRFFDAEKASLYPFTRYTKINRGGKLNEDGAYSRIDAGLAFLPLSQLALKFDVGRDFYEDENRNRTYLNGGIGYDF